MKSSIYFVLLIASLVGCAKGADEETSVHLLVNNGPGAPLPVEVKIDIFEGTSQQFRETVTRGVPNGANKLLGDLVVYPAPGTSLLRFVVTGKRDGLTISSATASAVPKEGTQTQLVATLTAAMVGAGDAGMAGDDANNADGGTLSPKRMLGSTCAEGQECESGFCVDKLCCDVACEGACNTCKSPGQPAGKCVALPDGMKCAEPSCSGNRRVLSQRACSAGACKLQDQTCAMKACDAATLMCR